MEEDRLSNLPKFILHDILSRLSRKEAARTSVLSKVWAETWSIFPILSFCENEIIGWNLMDSDFVETKDYLRERKKFCDKVERTLLRFCNKGLAIKQFQLFVNSFQNFSKDFNHWLKLICETGVERLELYQSSGYVRKEFQDQCYILPTSVFEAKSLTELVLSGRMRFDLTFVNHPVKFFSLRVLTLENCVYIANEQLKHLISCCPLIEHITLWCCVYSSGETHLDYIMTKSLSLHGLPTLKSVNVCEIQEVNVDSPNLENFHYCFRDPDAPCKINFDRCRNLKCLSLICSENNTTITENWFLELFQKFPILEDLSLYDCTMPRKINISSDRLKWLSLSPCSKVKEINIVAPNLLSCSHMGLRSDVMKSRLTLYDGSSELVVNIEIVIDYQYLSNFEEFIKTSISYHNWPSISISLYTHWPIAVESHPIILQFPPYPPPSIKHLILRNVPDNEALYLRFVNGLLLCCCPATISICSDSLRCNKAFIEVFYGVLGKNKDNCLCNSCRLKCWWHDLKSVKVSSSTKNGENIHFKTLFDAFEASANMDTISFNLEF